jgi:hypothetical protein
LDKQIVTDTFEISPLYGRITMDKKYEIIIYWSSEDNAYVA